MSGQNSLSPGPPGDSMMTDKDSERIATLVAEWLDGRDDGEMYDACTENPEAAWQVILTLVDRELTEDQVADLACEKLKDGVECCFCHGTTFLYAEVLCQKNTRSLRDVML